MDVHSIRRLITSPWKGVFIVTGGGATIISDILSQPGASSTVLEALIPYSRESVEALLGYIPEKACDLNAATLFATVAYERAKRYAKDSKEHVFGLGATAALTTTPPRRGADRICIALHTVDFQMCISADSAFENTSGRCEQELVAVREIWSILNNLHPRP